MRHGPIAALVLLPLLVACPREAEGPGSPGRAEQPVAEGRAEQPVDEGRAEQPAAEAPGPAPTAEGQGADAPLEPGVEPTESAQELASPGAARSVVAGQVAEEAAEWTAGVREAEHALERPAYLRAVRTGRHEGFDRVVLEFDPAVPGWHAEYVDRPVRECGSGNTVEVAGEGWLELRMEPAHAHDDEGNVTVDQRERRPKLPVLKELELTGDFEAQVTWVLGVKAPNRYRVTELSDPPRLVVDVKH